MQRMISAAPLLRASHDWRVHWVTRWLESNVIVWKGGTRSALPRIAPSKGGEAPVAGVVEGWGVPGIAWTHCPVLRLCWSNDRACAGSGIVARTVQSWWTTDGGRRQFVGGSLPNDQITLLVMESLQTSLTFTYCKISNYRLTKMQSLRHRKVNFLVQNFTTGCDK